MARILVGAFDPSARVAIDKLPVDLWLQVALTKLLGFGAFALLLPAARRNARRRCALRPPAPPRARGGGSARAWLALGTVLFSAQGALGPRYLEAFDPAVGACLGAGAALAGEALPARLRP